MTAAGKRSKGPRRDEERDESKRHNQILVFFEKWKRKLVWIVSYHCLLIDRPTKTFRIGKGSSKEKG